MRNRSNGLSLSLFFTALFVFFAAACFTGDKAVASETLNYRLKWLFNASVIGDIYALDRGFFEKAGLNVQVKEGGPERNAIRELELGQAQFGVASADQVIHALEKGSPVVVLAQLFQVNPLHWIYRSDNFRVERLEDLKGKTIGITFGGNDENIMKTLLAKADIMEKDYTAYSVRYDLTPFYQKKADLWPCYINSQGPILKKKLEKEGESVGFLNPAEYGVKFVANSVVTSRKMMDAHPETVQKFIRALMAAWEAAIDPANEAGVLETLKKFDKGATAELQQDQLTETRPLVKPSPEIPIGAIDVDAWKQTEQIMLNGKQIDKPVHVENVLKPLTQ